MNFFEEQVNLYELPYGFFIKVEKGESLSQFYMCHKRFHDEMFMFDLVTEQMESVSSEEDVAFINALIYAKLYAKKYFDYENREAFLGKVAHTDDEYQDEHGCPLCRAIRTRLDFSA